MAEHRTDYEIASDSLEFAKKEAEAKAQELAAIHSLLIDANEEQKPGWKAAYDDALRKLRLAEQYVGECQVRRSNAAMPIGYRR